MVLVVSEVFDELSGNEATVFSVFDFCRELLDAETGVSWNSNDVFDVRGESCFFEEVAEDCERGEQHSGSTLALCRCVGRVRRCSGERRLEPVSCSSGSE